jgi:iron transport multicopper oxidase
MGQYPDGFRGAFIVHDPKPPFHYDDEFTITLSEWYHREMADLLHEYLSEENLQAFAGNEPVPNSALINDSTNTKIKVEPNKTYLVHIICVGNWPGHTWVLDGHEMTVVEVDGVYTEPYTVGSKMLRVAPGQRTSVLIHTKPDASENFAIWDTMDINMMFVYENRTIPENYNPNVTAWLVYDEAKPLPPPPVLYEFDFADDVTFVPLDKEPLLQPVNKQIIIDTSSTEINGIRRFTINNKTYIPQEVPTLYTANTIGKDLASNPEVYGQVNPFVVNYGDVVEIVINNHHDNLHPWHLHGHEFQVLERTGVDGGYFTGAYSANISQTPIRRDTIMVQNYGHAVLRFRANNPGVWLLHCHIEWHVEAGLVATIIEAPETFPESQHAPPQSHYDSCAAYPDPFNGNAAGKKGLDLSGANTEVETDTYGAMYNYKGAVAAAPSAPSASSASAVVASSAPAPVPEKPQTTSVPPPPAATAPEYTQAPPPAAIAPEHTWVPPPGQGPIPTPTHHIRPPPHQQPAHEAPAPEALSQPAPQAPALQQEAPAPQPPVAQVPAPQQEAPAPQCPVAHVPAPQEPASQQETPAPQPPVPQVPAPQEPAPQLETPAPQPPVPAPQEPAPQQEAPVPQPPVTQVPAPQEPAPQGMPEYPEYPTPEPAEGVPVYPVPLAPPPPDEPIYVHEHDSK